jgi:alanine dehydrogenase
LGVGWGGDVTVVDRRGGVLYRLAARCGPAHTTVYPPAAAVEELVVGADLVIGAVLIKGARAPKLVTAEMVKQMRSGSVLVDVAIDQGGCMETSHPTTHREPTYVIDEVVHYAVANMPGAVPRTSTAALNNSTLPFVVALAGKGVKQALSDDRHLLNGLNDWCGAVTEEAVAVALDRPYVEPASALLGL